MNTKVMYPHHKRVQQQHHVTGFFRNPAQHSVLLGVKLSYEPVNPSVGWMVSRSAVVGLSFIISSFTSRAPHGVLVLPVDHRTMGAGICPREQKSFLFQPQRWEFIIINVLVKSVYFLKYIFGFLMYFLITKQVLIDLFFTTMNYLIINVTCE